MQSRQDWSVRVRVLLSSSEWEWKTRACALSPTCARAAGVTWAGSARGAKGADQAAGGSAARREAADSRRPPSGRGEGLRAEAGVAAR